MSASALSIVDMPKGTTPKGNAAHQILTLSGLKPRLLAVEQITLKAVKTSLKLFFYDTASNIFF